MFSLMLSKGHISFWVVQGDKLGGYRRDVGKSSVARSVEREVAVETGKEVSAFKIHFVAGAG